MAEEEFILCPRCKAQRPKSDILCGKCGARLKEPMAPLEKAAKKPAETPKEAKPEEKPKEAKEGEKPKDAKGGEKPAEGKEGEKKEGEKPKKKLTPEELAKAKALKAALDREKKKKKAIMIIGGIVIIAIIALLFIPFGPTECPESCDDLNDCTRDYCSEDTRFYCMYDNLTGEQGDCSSDDPCIKKECLNGACETTQLDICCGNDRCDVGEDCIGCSNDCKCSLGERCTSNEQCSSNNCLAGECKAPGDKCGNRNCDSGEGCSSCPEDCACRSDYKCENNECVEKERCGNGVCGEGETCANCEDDCGPCKLADGENCTADTDCVNNYCVHGMCRSNETYCGDLHCDEPEENCSNCAGDCCLPYGARCDTDDECDSGYCVHRVCRNDSTHCGDDYCDEGEYCVEDCGYWGDFSICTHAFNCNGNDSRTVNNAIGGDEWTYGNATYCMGSNCIDIGLFEFEVLEVDEYDARVKVKRPTGTTQDVDLSVGDCQSAGDVLICLDDID